jgi:hypothetical protein
LKSDKDGDASQGTREPRNVHSILLSAVVLVSAWFLLKFRVRQRPDVSGEQQDHADFKIADRTDRGARPATISSGSVFSPANRAEEEHATQERREKRERSELRVQWLTFFALVLYTAFTFLLLLQTKKATEKTGETADAAKRAADTATNQLELSERPWIQITNVQTIGNTPAIPALSFQQSIRHQQATFQLVVSVKNIGHSVADLAVRYELFFPLWKTFGTVVPVEEKRFCGGYYHRQ